MHFARHGSALRAVCAPCRIEASRLAAQTEYIDRLQLRLVQLDARTIAGELKGGDVEMSFTARLQPDRIDVDWRLPPTEIAAVYRLLASVIPKRTWRTSRGASRRAAACACRSGARGSNR